MLYKLEETLYHLSITPGQSVEMAMVDYLASQGYQAIHHDYFLFHDSKKTRYPENEGILRRIIGERPLSELRYMASILYPWGVGAGVAPEQPDIFAYKPKGDFFFCEVKQKRTGDRLRPPQMLGISLIKIFLGCPVQLAVVIGSNEKAPSKTKQYQWIWPCIQECGFLEVDLNADNKKRG